MIARQPIADGVLADTPGRRAATARRRRVINAFLGYERRAVARRLDWEREEWRRFGRRRARQGAPPWPTQRAFLARLARRGTPVAKRTFARWHQHYHLSGWRGLGDRRGRHPGRWPVEGWLWDKFCGLVDAGRSVRAARIRLECEARCRGVWLPATRTLQLRVRELRAALGGNEHLRPVPWWN